MSDGNHPISQVVVVQAQKIADFEQRLNALLADLDASEVIEIDYMIEPQVYGFCAFVRFLARA